MKYQNNELFDELNPYIWDVPGFPREGIIFKDITPTLHTPEIFKKVVDSMAEIGNELNFNKIICADARGFLFGSPLSYATGKPFVIARKPGKLPRPGQMRKYALEYGEDALVISKDAIQPGDRIIIVDDLLATGGSALAMIDIIKKSGATPVACIFYIELCLLGATEKIKKQENVPCYSLVKYVDVM